MPRPAADFIGTPGKELHDRVGLALAEVQAGLTRHSSMSWPSLIGFAKSKKYAPLASLNQS
jgi:hypothetical protein